METKEETVIQKSYKQSIPGGIDVRRIGAGSQILRDLGVYKIALLGSKTRYPSISGFGLEVVKYIEMKKNINLDLQKSDYSESKVLIISTKWNEEVIQSMLDGLQRNFKNLESEFSEVNVPGAFEIPFMVNNQAKSYDAIITIEHHQRRNSTFRHHRKIH